MMFCNVLKINMLRNMAQDRCAEIRKASWEDAVRVLVKR